MREIVIDSETTGFDPLNGGRIVEIEAAGPFRHVFHSYLKPERAMPADAIAIHGSYWSVSGHNALTMR